MISPNNGGDKTLNRYLSPTSNISCVRNGLYLVEPLAKGAVWKPQTSQVISKAIGCSPQTDDKPYC